jgi:hypothetical protein
MLEKPEAAHEVLAPSTTAPGDRHRERDVNGRRDAVDDKSQSFVIFVFFVVTPESFFLRRKRRLDPFHVDAAQP